MMTDEDFNIGKFYNLYDNFEFSAFLYGRKFFFNWYDDFDLLIFPRGKQKRKYFYLLYDIFTQCNDIFSKKYKCRDHLNWPHISKFSLNKILILPKT